MIQLNFHIKVDKLPLTQYLIQYMWSLIILWKSMPHYICFSVGAVAQKAKVARADLQPFSACLGGNCVGRLSCSCARRINLASSDQISESDQLIALPRETSCSLRVSEGETIQTTTHFCRLHTDRREVPFVRWVYTQINGFLEGELPLVFIHSGKLLLSPSEPLLLIMMSDHYIHSNSQSKALYHRTHCLWV